MTYIAMGGNIGETTAIFEKMLEKLRQKPFIQNLEFSCFYKTPPWGGIPQRDFTNAVCRFKTYLSPEEIFQNLQCIETQFGKEKIEKNGPRTLDLDLLFYGNVSFQSDHLLIPHPRWSERLFVLLPLRDLTSTVEIDGKIYKINMILNTFSECEISKHICLNRSNQWIMQSR